MPEYFLYHIGACNPPTDAGRFPLSDRFLRHSPLMFVDYPGRESLRHIYGTLMVGTLKLVPPCKDMATNLANAMVQFWVESAKHFTTDMQPHYLYSPRELTRWKVAILEAIHGEGGDNLSPLEMTRLYLHEAGRIFIDRLVNLDERAWSNEQLDNIAREYLSAGDRELKRPIFFSKALFTITTFRLLMLIILKSFCVFFGLPQVF